MLSILNRNLWGGLFVCNRPLKEQKYFVMFEVMVKQTQLFKEKALGESFSLRDNM